MEITSSTTVSPVAGARVAFDSDRSDPDTSDDVFIKTCSPCVGESLGQRGR